MYSPSEGISPENTVVDTSINSLYLRGLEYYSELSELLLCPAVSDEDIAERRYQIETTKMFVIKSLEQSLKQVGECHEQLLKIQALLLLIKLYGEDENKTQRENYFYQMVEIARRYMGSDFTSTLLGKSILDCYTSDIDPNFSRTFYSQDAAVWTRYVSLVILSESDKRREQQAGNLKDFLGTFHTEAEIFQKLEEQARGSVRLHITWESGEILVEYHSRETPIKDTQCVREITVDIFNKPRKYSVLLDFGSEERENQFEEPQFWDVRKIIEYIISQREYDFFKAASGKNSTIEILEENRKISRTQNNYAPFITRVMKASGIFFEWKESARYISCCRKAFDICRNITLGGSIKDTDQILGGKIERRVLRMAQSLLLSRNETMNGTGYPFGHSKEYISLEGRMYKVIRAYEALCGFGSPIHAVHSLQEWAEEGYFDRAILQIFLENLEEIVPVKKEVTSSLPLSSRRRKYFTKHRKLCQQILQLIHGIEENYSEGRESADSQARSVLFKRANEQKSLLLQVADTRNILDITPHGKAESDFLEWPPGHELEHITQEWVESSLEKGKKLAWLRFITFTSPLPRARETIALILGQVQKFVKQILSISTEELSARNFHPVIVEESITNPPKSTESDRYDALLEKYLVDPNVPGLRRLLKKLLSSSREEVYLFVTHRDTARHLVISLRNLFAKETISGEKMPIENDEIYEFLFRGDSLVEENDFSRKLLFSLTDWKVLMRELGALTEEIFGEVFSYAEDTGGIHLILLHDEFLDFLDQQYEKSGEKVKIFMSRLKKNPHTKRFAKILQKCN